MLLNAQNYILGFRVPWAGYKQRKSKSIMNNQEMHVFSVKHVFIMYSIKTKTIKILLTKSFNKNDDKLGLS